MLNYACPWRLPVERRFGLGAAKLTFVKPFIGGKPTRYFRMLDLVKSQGPMSRREIVAQSFGTDETQKFPEIVQESIRMWKNVSYSDYFVAFGQAGLLTYNHSIRKWEKGPMLYAWYEEVVNPYLASQRKVKEEAVHESDGLTTDRRLEILYEATRIKMQKLIEDRNKLDHEIRTVDRVLTAVETIRTFFPIMED